MAEPKTRPSYYYTGWGVQGARAGSGCCPQLRRARVAVFSVCVFPFLFSFSDITHIASSVEVLLYRAATINDCLNPFSNKVRKKGHSHDAWTRETKAPPQGV